MNMQKISRFLFFFATAWLILNFLGVGKKPVEYTDDVVILAKDKYTIRSAITVDVFNNTDKEISIDNNCEIIPLKVEIYRNGEWGEISERRVSSENCTDPLIIPSKEKRVFSYANESDKLFGEVGKYRISIPYEGKLFSHEFEIKPLGIFKSTWVLIVYKPIYNLLIWLVSVLPGHSLGFSIIILTILVRLVLLVPNHKALKNQKVMQKVQPELQAVKEKYKGDQAKIAQETMAIWKKHKVNPAGSCLPILLQFPVLIAVFFVMKSGLSHNNMYLLYDMFQGFDYSIINPDFFGINLTHKALWYIAIIVGGLQFLQMKLSFPKQKLSEKSKDDEKGGIMELQMKMMSKMFTYVMPVMIAFFTLSMPAGVGMYWAISTLFSIGQQYFINKIL